MEAHSFPPAVMDIRPGPAFLAAVANASLWSALAVLFWLFPSGEGVFPVGAVFIPFAGLGWASAARLRNTTQLAVDEAGISLRRRERTLRTIPWDDLRRVTYATDRTAHSASPQTTVPWPVAILNLGGRRLRQRVRVTRDYRRFDWATLGEMTKIVLAEAGRREAKVKRMMLRS